MLFAKCLGLFAFAAVLGAIPLRAGAAVPDRTLTSAAFTFPVEGLASLVAFSPDGRWLAVLAQTGGALDVIDTRESVLTARLEAPAE
jgi:hypothetical protein